MLDSVVNETRLVIQPGVAGTLETYWNPVALDILLQEENGQINLI
jgi:hypothetical protein